MAAVLPANRLSGVGRRGCAAHCIISPSLHEASPCHAATAHPYPVGMDIAALAPKVAVTVYPWRAKGPARQDGQPGTRLPPGTSTRDSRPRRRAPTPSDGRCQGARGPCWRGCPYSRSTNSTMLPSGSWTMAMVVPGLMAVLGRVKVMCSASNRWITSSRLVTTKVR
jgi:hypothetical protein